MIPLIDVMLVLLVIFIITAPLLTHAVKVDLPKASSQPNLTKPDNIQLAIDADGTRVLERRGLDRPAGAAHGRGGHNAATRGALARRRPVAYRNVAEVHGRRREGRPDAHRLRHRSPAESGARSGLGPHPQQVVVDSP